MPQKLYPEIGQVVWYRTDGRNGLSYDLPAIITCTINTHPGDYPDGARNPLPIPDENCAHLTVFTPGGFGTELFDYEGAHTAVPSDDRFPGAQQLVPGSGTYVEWNVPFVDSFPDEESHVSEDIPPRSWRWANLP